MMERLLSHEEWLRFLDYKREGGHLAAAEERQLTEWIEKRKYLTTAKSLKNGGFFSLPQAVQVNKSGAGKKRTVFVFEESEKLVQKFIAFCLLDYDDLFADNCYAFRRNSGVKKAVRRLVFDRGINQCYAFKLDISDYFNSVDAALLLSMLKQALAGEAGLYRVLEEMLTNPYALEAGEAVKIKKGILAGSPVSGFLANLYLSALDWSFAKRQVRYARYSDDIIVFAESEAQLEEYQSEILSFLEAHHLKVNEKKVAYARPGEAWTFLGFAYEKGTIDIAPVSLQKMKKKMRRKARALHRWQLRKQLPPERAVRAMIRYFDKKLYHNPVKNEITWCRWYFPIINTDTSLKVLDGYLQQCLRFLATGTHNKGQYRFTYEQLQALGYTTLVHRYYQYKEHGEID